MKQSHAIFREKAFDETNGWGKVCVEEKGGERKRSNCTARELSQIQRYNEREREKRSELLKHI